MIREQESPRCPGYVFWTLKGKPSSPQQYENRKIVPQEEVGDSDSNSTDAKAFSSASKI
jgi:hypothetical protein